MRQKKKGRATTTVPWGLLGLLCLLSLVPALFYVTRPVSLQLLIQMSYLLSTAYPLVLAWLCFHGSRPLLWPSCSSPHIQQGSLRFSPAFLGLALLCFTVANVVLFVQVVVMGQPITFPSPHHYLRPSSVIVL